MLSGARRADAVQRAILQWLDEQEVEPSSLSDFLEIGPRPLLGRPTCRLATATTARAAPPATPHARPANPQDRPRARRQVGRRWATAEGGLTPRCQDSSVTG